MNTQEENTEIVEQEVEVVETQNNTSNQQIEVEQQSQIQDNISVNDDFVPSEEYKNLIHQEDNNNSNNPIIELNDEQVFNYLKNKGLDINFNSSEELVQSIKSKNAIKQELQPLEEFLSQGNKIEDFVKIHNEVNKDFSKLPFDEITQNFLLEQGYNEKEIKAKLKLLKLKEIDEDFMSEEDITEIEEHNESVNLEREKLLNQALNHFNSKKSSFNELINPKKISEEEMVKQIEKFKNHISNELKSFDKIQVQNGKYGTQNFSVSKEVKEEIQSFVENPSKFTEKYFDFQNAKNGVVPYKSGGEKLLAEDLFFLKNRDAIIEKAFLNGKELGIKIVQKNRENVNFENIKNNSDNNSEQVNKTTIPRSVMDSIFRN